MGGEGDDSIYDKIQSINQQIFNLKKLAHKMVLDNFWICYRQFIRIIWPIWKSQNIIAQTLLVNYVKL